MHPSNKVTLADLDNVFKYHDHPSKDHKYPRVREAAKELARVILEEAPECTDRTIAVHTVREAVMWAAGAIALDPIEGE